MNITDPLEPLLVDADRISDPLFKNTTMFAFSARSGSTAITDGIARMGHARRVDEIFNPRGPVQNLLEVYSGIDLVDYMNCIHKGAMLGDRLLFKTNFVDFAPVIERYDIRKIFPNLSVVYIERRDKVMQAVSVYRAIITNEWHKQSSAEKEILKPLDDTMFNLNRIITFKEGFESECKKWNEFFKNNDLEPLRVLYENFDVNPENVLKLIYEHIEGKKYTKKVELGYERLRDELSERWAAKVYEALMK